MEHINLLASFAAPMNITTSGGSLLWLLPLAAAIAVVYKVTKLPQLKLLNFVKESGLLFLSIIAFTGVTAAVLYVVQYLFT